MIRFGLTALAALFGVGLIGPTALAQQVPFVREVKIGFLNHDMPGLWSGLQRERGIGINGELILSPSVPLFGGHVRPALGGTYTVSTNNRPAMSKAYADVRWMFEAQSGMFVSLGIGAAVHSGVIGGNAGDDVSRKWLGHRVLFHIPLEVGFRLDAHQSVSLYFDHVSNGYTSTYNEGLDTLGVRYGYKF